MHTGFVKDLLAKVNWETLERYVKLAEKLFKDGTIEDRKAFVVAQINALVDIPILPESVEAVIFDWIIDLVVDGLDRMLGKNWFGPEEQSNVPS